MNNKLSHRGFVFLSHCNTLRALKKVPSGHLGQADFPAGQLTFHSHLPNGRGSGQVVFELNKINVMQCMQKQL